MQLSKDIVDYIQTETSVLFAYADVPESAQRPTQPTRMEWHYRTQTTRLVLVYKSIVFDGRRPEGV